MKLKKPRWVRFGKRMVLALMLTSLALSFLVLPDSTVHADLVTPTDSSRFSFTYPDALCAIGLCGVKLERELCWTPQPSFFYDYAHGKKYSKMAGVIDYPGANQTVIVPEATTMCVPALDGNYSFSVAVGPASLASDIPFEDRFGCVLYGNDSVSNCSNAPQIALTERFTLESHLLLAFALFIVMLNVASNVRTLTRK